MGRASHWTPPNPTQQPSYIYNNTIFIPPNGERKTLTLAALHLPDGVRRSSPSRPRIVDCADPISLHCDSAQLHSHFSQALHQRCLTPSDAQAVYDTGLSRFTTDENLRKAFEPFGKLVEAKVIMDRVTNRSKGFGFITYSTIEEADKAREGMNAKFLDGWVIFVDPAKPREPRPPPPPPPQSQQQTPEIGFRTNKTVGWCG
ncbi:Organelle RRM domain-containing protein [Drosera capensis]